MKNLNNKLWLAWFFGFADAEGNFQVFPKKRTNVKGETTHYGVGYHFHMGLSTVDMELLKSIKNAFGNIGKIYTYPVKEEAHYAISRVDDIRWLVENVLDLYPLLTLHQSSRYNQLRTGLIEGIKRFNTLDEYKTYFDAHVLTQSPSILGLSQEFIDSWIVGFINGEGCFTHAAGATGARFVLEHTDKAVLEMIVARLGTNTNVSTRPSRNGRKVTYSMELSTRKDLNLLINFLNSSVTLQGNKYRQYQYWLTNTIKQS